MRNFEKYKTIDEKVIAHVDYCEKTTGSDYCRNNGCRACIFKWLELEHEELKPCPFCGGEARVDDDLCHSDMSKTFYSVICKKCGARTTNNFTLKEDAIEQWNRRAK